MTIVKSNYNIKNDYTLSCSNRVNIIYETIIRHMDVILSDFDTIKKDVPQGIPL